MMKFNEHPRFTLKIDNHVSLEVDGNKTVLSEIRDYSTDRVNLSSNQFEQMCVAFLDLRERERKLRNAS